MLSQWWDLKILERSFSGSGGRGLGCDHIGGRGMSSGGSSCDCGSDSAESNKDDWNEKKLFEPFHSGKQPSDTCDFVIIAMEMWTQLCCKDGGCSMELFEQNGQTQHDFDERCGSMD